MTETPDWDTIEQAQSDELAELRADRETLRTVSEELLDARLALRMIASSLSPRARKRIEQGADWVKLPRRGARVLFDFLDHQGAR